MFSHLNIICVHTDVFGNLHQSLFFGLNWSTRSDATTPNDRLVDEFRVLGRSLTPKTDLLRVEVACHAHVIHAVHVWTRGLTIDIDIWKLVEHVNTTLLLDESGKGSEPLLELGHLFSSSLEIVVQVLVLLLSLLVLLVEDEQVFLH